MELAAFLRFNWLYIRGSSHQMTEQLVESEAYAPDWPVSSVRGRKIIKRQFDFCGYKVEMAGRINWQVEEVGEDWPREFFSYSWLQDVASIHSEKIASSFAREFINGFTLEPPHQLHETAWESEVTGERLTHWLYYRHFVLKGGTHTFFTRYQRAIIRHMRYLYAQAKQDSAAIGPNALKGKITAAVVLPGLRPFLPELLEWLEAVVQRDLFPDGGHISQSPSHHLAFVKTLIEIKYTLALADLVSVPLDDAIISMARFLHLICHGDGRLALFHHNMMNDAALIERVMELSEVDVLPGAAYAPESGYLACQGKQSKIMMRMMPKGDAHVPHGIGSIECSHGKERIIVNCGFYEGPSAGWHAAMDSPDAFSRVILDEPGTMPETLSCFQNLEEKASRQVAILRYPLSEEITHERQIEMHKDGSLMKGKDSIVVNQLGEAARQEKQSFAHLRFHLHPDIRCQPQKEGGIMLASVHGSNWLFTSSHQKDTTIEESVYLGYYGKPQKTLQMVMHVALDENQNVVRWELRQVER